MRNARFLRWHPIQRATVVALFSSLLVILAGCGPAGAEPDPAPTAAATVSEPGPTTAPGAATPSPTPPDDPTPVGATPTSEPTATPPTATPKFIPTVTPTHDPPTPAPTPTLAPTATLTPVEDCRATYESPILSGPNGPEGADNDSVFRSLTVHPTNADIVLLGTERNGFVRSQDGGASWTRLRTGLRSDPIALYPEVWDIAFAPNQPSIIYAATLDSPGPIVGSVPSVGAGVYRSADGGATWAQVNCGFPTSRANSVVVSPANPDIAVAGMEGGEASFDPARTFYPGGIHRTTDGGQNWTKVDIHPDDGLNGYLVMKQVLDTPTTIVTFGKGYDDLSKNAGFLRSTDMGATWEMFAPELRYKHIASFTLANDGQTIYANEDGTYFGWISTDAGATWRQSPIHQVNGPIAVSPVDPNLVVFSSQSQLRRSTNGLASVTVVGEAANPFREIVFAPSDPSVVYAETDGYLLYRSDDAGITWRFVVNVRDEVLNVQP